MNTDNLKVPGNSIKIYAMGSLLVSALLVLLIWLDWKKVGRAEPSKDTIVVFNQEELNDFKEQQNTRVKDRAAQFHSDDNLYEIPTGVFIQSMIFASSSNVNLTGFIWQEYPVDFPYERGVSFPEQISSGDTTDELQYCYAITKDVDPVDLKQNRREVTDDCAALLNGDLSSVVDEKVTSHLFGWYFDVTLRQSFDYKKYPMDFQTLWLRIWPKEIAYDQNILLVPDFEAYAFMDREHEKGRRSEYPKGPFGLDMGLVSGEWMIDTSYFSYREIEYDTNFGFHRGAGREGVSKKDKKFAGSRYQELHFNIGANRKFESAFIKNLLPLFVVGLLLFSSIMTVTDDKEQSSRFGFSTSGLLGTCSALFFVVMLSHIQVRSMFAGSGLVYIEYFYLVMYLYILLSALNGYLFSLKGLEDFWLLHYGDNIVAKVSFWPVLLFLMLVVGWYVL